MKEIDIRRTDSRRRLEFHPNEKLFLVNALREILSDVPLLNLDTEIDHAQGFLLR